MQVWAESHHAVSFPKASAVLFGLELNERNLDKRALHPERFLLL